MKDRLRKYEQEQMEMLEGKLRKGEYEEEYMISKENLEDKIQQKMRRTESRDKKNYWWRTGKIAAACVAAVMIMAVSVPGIRAAAVNFLHSTVGLKIAGVEADRDETAGKGQGFSFEWLMQFTEKEYWEWLQANELSGRELPAYVPEGFRAVENMPDAYEYLYVENHDVPWSDKKINPEDDSTYGRFGKVGMPSKLSEAEKRKEVADHAALCGMSRTWKNGQKELYYRREIYDIFELKGHEEEKEEAAKKVMVDGSEGYIFREDGGTWLYVFGETGITRLYAGGGIQYPQAENMLVKMAESVQK